MPSFSAENHNPDLTAELRGKLYSFILSRVRNVMVAEDLTQETLVRTAKALNSSKVENLQGWLFRVARNAVADHFRGSRDQVQWNEQVHGEIVEETVLSREEDVLREALNAYVRGVVEQLPPVYREALLLTEYEGLSQKALAERLGISLPAAKSRVLRGRAELRRIVERCCHFATDVYGQVTDCEPRKQGNCNC